jgi:hypothetical protein
MSMRRTCRNDVQAGHSGAPPGRRAVVGRWQLLLAFGRRNGSSLITILRQAAQAEARANAIMVEWASNRRDRRLDGRGVFRSTGAPSSPEKGEQVGIELVFARVGETVRATRVDFQGRVLDEFGRGVSRGADRHDLVVVAVDD